MVFPLPYREGKAEEISLEGRAVLKTHPSGYGVGFDPSSSGQMRSCHSTQYATRSTGPIYICIMMEGDDIFYLEPMEGGGVFEFSPSQCSLLSDTYILISFCKGEIALKVMDYFGDAQGDVQTVGEAATLSPSRNGS